MTLPTEALDRFEQGLQAAIDAGEHEPTAMSLATTTLAGKISVRTVLLKHYDQAGFVFYTNIHSRKGQQLAEHSQAALCFFWKSTAQQVVIEGTAQPVADAEADRYFASRNRGSQLGAWASLQSEVLDSRKTLEKRMAEFEQKFSGESVPRPPHWSGYRINPEMIEFWYGKASRLHDRFRYFIQDGIWDRQRLYP